MIKLTALALLIAVSSQAQEYIGIKTSELGSCHLYRERFVTDANQFGGDLKKQIEFKEVLIAAGKRKVSILTSLDKSNIKLDITEDAVIGKDLVWTFEFCAYGKSASKHEMLIKSTGAAQKVFANPDHSYTIENPKVLHAGQVYLLVDPRWYEAGFEDTLAGTRNSIVILKSLCKRFGFKKYISMNAQRLAHVDAARLSKNAIVRDVDANQTIDVIHQLTCK